MRRVDGERLVGLRCDRFMDRRDLAEKSGVSYSTIYKMETKDYMPSLRKLKDIARALKVRPEELVAEEAEEAEARSLAGAIA